MQNFIKIIISAIKSWTKAEIKKNRTHWGDILDAPSNIATTDEVQGAVDFTMSEVNNALTTANAAQSTADENANKLLTYKQRTCILPSNRSWIGLAYGDGKFVASAMNARYAAYSEDGISWVETTMPTKASWREVTYGNGKFVIVSYGSNTVAYSEDGINWAKTTMPVTDNWNSIAYGNGRFVAIANSSANGAYSINGTTWYQTTLPSNSTWQRVIYGNSKFVAIAGNDKDGMGGKDIAYSNDGVNWTPVSNPITSASPISIAYGNGRFVIFATNYPFSSPASIAYSEDGINWISTNVQFSYSNIQYITYGNGKFVLVGSNGFAAYSEDGISWVETTMPTKAFWHNVIYDDDKFIAIANCSTDAAYSEDGINWSSEYIAIIQNEENKTNEIRNLILEGNTPIPSPSTATIGQTIVVKNADENGKPTEWESADRNKFDFMFLIDDTTSYEYIIRMQNGNLTSICKASSLAVSTLPTKTAYTVGEALDLTDMVVTLTRQDGATEEVDNYSYTEPDMSVAGTVDVTVSYVEAGETYSATFAVTITEATTTEETETTT